MASLRTKFRKERRLVTVVLSWKVLTLWLLRLSPGKGSTSLTEQGDCGRSSQKSLLALPSRYLLLKLLPVLKLTD